jgi:hypothetical protein
MTKNAGRGRAHICYPEKHIKGALSGGTLPQFNNPNYQVKEQFQPTGAHPLRRHHLRASYTRGHVK